MYYIQWPQNFEWILLIITAGVVFFKVGCSDRYNSRFWMICCATSVILTLSWFYTDKNYTFLLYIALFVIGAVDVDYKKILKVSLFVNLYTFILAFLGSCAEVITNLAYVQNDGGCKQSFGIVYTTDFAARVLYLVLVGWVVYGEILYPLLNIVLTALITVFVYYYTNARCSSAVLCMMIAGMIYYYYAVNGKKHFRVTDIVMKAVNRLLSVSMIIFAAFSLIMTYIYDNEQEWIVLLDKVLSNRLRLGKEAMENYGFSWFGTAFDQNGAGGSQTYNLYYNFVDSSYVLIALRYGTAVLVVLCGVWTYLAWKALKKKDIKLIIVLFLVTVHSIIEHHFTEINYNIFIILVFAGMQETELVAVAKNSNKDVDRRKKYIQTGIAAFIVIICIFSGRAFNIVRTLVKLLWLFENKKQIYFIAFITAGAAYIILFIYLVYMAWHNNADKKKKTILITSIAVLILCAVGATVKAESIIQHGIDAYSDTLAQEQNAIEKLTGLEDIKICVQDMPEVYRRKFGNRIASAILPIEAYSDRENIAVIMPLDAEEREFTMNGFYFGELSDAHGIYTNDEEAIEILQNSGITMSGIYSVVKNVDMAYMADMNGLEMTEDGAVIVDGNEKSILHGPWIERNKGSMIVEYQIEVLDNPEQLDYLGTAIVSSYSGKITLGTTDIYAENINQDGTCTVQCQVNLWNGMNGVEFLLRGENGVRIKVNSITYRNAE
jgi:hypothetical protein